MWSTVVVVARQAGTAAAFLPLIAHLRFAHRAAVTVFAYGAAQPELSSLEDVVAVDAFTDAAVQDRLPEQLDLLLTGTSLEVEDDAHWWRWASGRGVYSVAFVDQWVNYAKRFTLPGEPSFSVLPDCIAVVDEVARRGMLEAGAPPDRLRVGGSPALDTVASPALNAEAVRAALGLDHRTVLVVYVAEPAGDRDDTPLALPEELVSTVERVAEEVGVHVLITIKRHPRQAAAVAPVEVTSAGPRVAVSVLTGLLDRISLVNAADLVLGARSFLLHEAREAGAPVVSFALEKAGRWDAVEERDGIAVATTQPALHASVATHLRVGARRRAPRAKQRSRLFLEAIAPLEQEAR